MSFLQDTLRPGPTSLSRINTASSPQLRKKSSFGKLLDVTNRVVRNPTGVLHDAWNLWSVEEERGQKRPSLTLEEQNRRELLYVRMKEAMTFEDWQDCAAELDRLEGNDDWKKERESPEYDFGVLEAQLRKFEDARIGCDLNKMMYLIRTSLHRGLGGMGDIRLYKHSHIGTKDTIERYIDCVKSTFETVVDLCDKQISRGEDVRMIQDDMIQARQAFGRSALLLSGGGTLGMNHIGVVKVLWEKNLLPRIISGSSAGSIVCSVICSRTDAEVPEILHNMVHGELDVFEKQGQEENFVRKVVRFLTDGALFDISHLIRVMKGLLGDMTFQEAYNRTRRILNISVSSASIHELERLLNYVTAPNVVIWSAVAASCSVPFIFSPASLLAKDLHTNELIPWAPAAQQWMDGSVDGDLPMTRLAEMFNVNHFIVSQVNPHVTPFIKDVEDRIADEAHTSTKSQAAGPGIFRKFCELGKGEIMHRMAFAAELGVAPMTLTKLRSVLSQKYSGDITILPEIEYSAYMRILKNPDPDFMLGALLSGERATWPKLSRIQNHCAIELALDETIQQLRAKTVFSPEQVDIRLNTLALKAPQPRGRLARVSSLYRPTVSTPGSAEQSPRRSRPRSYIESHDQPQVLLFPPKATRSSLSPAILRRHDTAGPAIKVPGIAADVLSSSADDEQNDPNPFTDDGDFASSPGSMSSSSPADSSPQMRPEPELWGPVRSGQRLNIGSSWSLSSSRSQPTTPFYSSRLAQRLSNPSLVSLSSDASNRSDPALQNMGKSLSMTPRHAASQSQSAVERQYKALFHPRPGKEDFDTSAPSSPYITPPTPGMMGDLPISSIAAPAAGPSAPEVRKSVLSKVRGLAMSSSGASARDSSPIPPLDGGGKKSLKLKRKGVN